MSVICRIPLPGFAGIVIDVPLPMTPERLLWVSDLVRQILDTQVMRSVVKIEPNEDIVKMLSGEQPGRIVALGESGIPYKRENVK